MTDVPKLFAKPRVAGSKVPLPPDDPRARSDTPYLGPDGETVEDVVWWHRLAAQGDVDLSAAAPKNALQSAPAPAGKAEKAGA